MLTLLCWGTLVLVLANGAAWFTLMGAFKGTWKVLVALGGAATILVLVVLFAALIQLPVTSSHSTHRVGVALQT